MDWPNLKQRYHPGRRLPAGLVLLLIGGLAAGPIAAANHRPAPHPAAAPAGRRKPAAAISPAGLLPVTPQSLYFTDCAPCHGNRGEGRIGPQIAAMNLSAQVFDMRVRKGGLVMPAFSPARISDAQLAGLLAWVNALPPPPTPARLPAPNAHAPGAAIFQANCLACHGVEARGGIAPGILNTPLPLTRFLSQLRHGGGLMPAFTPAQISPLQADQIYGYLHPPLSSPEPGRRVPLPSVPNYVQLTLFACAALALLAQLGSEMLRRRHQAIAQEQARHQAWLTPEEADARLRIRIF